MELWTVQDERVLEDIERAGVYRVATENSFPYIDWLSETPDMFLLICYRWMARQLYLRTGQKAPAGTEFPIWAWYRQWGDAAGKSKHPGKPDMRSWTTDEPEKVVRLRLEVEAERVLLSNFDMWHMPLNQGYTSFFKDDSEAFDCWYESNNPQDPFQRDIWDFTKHSAFLYEARHKVVKSWNNIFEIEPVEYDADWVGDLKNDAIQAVFWEIREQDIVSAEHFTTRKAHRTA